MTRRHFLESLERENDYQYEYEKLEMICMKSRFTWSINSWIEAKFWNWNKRANYCSFEELRHQLGFSLKQPPKDVGINEYLLYSEMMVNLIVDLHLYNESELEEFVTALFSTINATISKAGFELKIIDNEYMIVEQNPVALEVADSIPELADTIIEYNHYLLKGDIERKKEIISKISYALEPKRRDLNKYCKRMTDDFFFLVNSMDIRHNNCDPSDPQNYNRQFAALSDEMKEKWYDAIYEQSLALFIMLEQQERNTMIEEFKHQMSV